MADFERSTPDASRAALLSLRNRRARELGAPFAVVERAGRGQCVVASREIAAGAIILRERPLPEPQRSLTLTPDAAAVSAPTAAAHATAPAYPRGVAALHNPRARDTAAWEEGKP